MTPKPIIIAGGGVAGLSTAIALARSGFDVRIFEKAPVLSEQGAGLQLGPNATAILHHWGLARDMLAHACQPEVIELHDGVGAKLLSTLPVGHFAREHWHAPYITIHRSDLQTLLKQAVEQHPQINLQCGAQVRGFSGTLESGFDIEVESQTGVETHHGSLFLACDGVWSHLHGENKAQFSGSIAWRATIKQQHLLTLFRNQNVRVFMGASGHFITYPIRGGQDYNLVAITNSKSYDDNNREILSRAFAHWQAPLSEIITSIENWSYWPIFIRRPPCFMGRCGVVFLGDSAHAATPFAAQGAAMAIEDAACLAKYIDNPARLNRQNLEAFAAERCQRVQQVAKRGALNRFVYHASGAVALVRNIYMRSRAPEKFLSDLDWLYRPKA